MLVAITLKNAVEPPGESTNGCGCVEMVGPAVTPMLIVTVRVALGRTPLLAVITKVALSAALVGLPVIVPVGRSFADLVTGLALTASPAE